MSIKVGDGHTLVSSTTRTSKLHCNECRKKIKKGDSVVFTLYFGQFEAIDCHGCGWDVMRGIEEELEDRANMNAAYNDHGQY